MKVEPITYDEIKPWILKKHYALRTPSISYAYGLYSEVNELIGVVSYGIPASPNLCVGVCGPEYKDKVIELNRLVIDDGIPSFLISQSLKMLPSPKIVVSYADCAMGHIGYVYQATNWLYTGKTKERTDMFAGEGYHARHHKGDSSIRQFRSSKHRYIYFIGKKIEKKLMRKALKYPVLDYPKGDTKKYDASAKISKQMLLV